MDLSQFGVTDFGKGFANVIRITTYGNRFGVTEFRLRILDNGFRTLVMDFGSRNFG